MLKKPVLVTLFVMMLVLLSLTTKRKKFDKGWMPARSICLKSSLGSQQRKLNYRGKLKTIYMKLLQDP